MPKRHSTASLFPLRECEEKKEQREWTEQREIELGWMRSQRNKGNKEKFEGANARSETVNDDGSSIALLPGLTSALLHSRLHFRIRSITRVTRFPTSLKYSIRRLRRRLPNRTRRATANCHLNILNASHVSNVVVRYTRNINIQCAPDCNWNLRDVRAMLRSDARYRESEIAINREKRGTRESLAVCETATP